MYTGTLISDLMATVEHAELKAQERLTAEERELRAIFAMQIPIAQGDQVFQGAA
jgi:hypothetical protein